MLPEVSTITMKRLRGCRSAAAGRLELEPGHAVVGVDRRLRSRCCTAPRSRRRRPCRSSRCPGPRPPGHRSRCRSRRRTRRCRRPLSCSSPAPPPASPLQIWQVPPSAPETSKTALDASVAGAPESTEMMPPPPPPPQSSQVPPGFWAQLGQLEPGCLALVSPPRAPAALISAVAPTVTSSPTSSSEPPAPPPPESLPSPQPRLPVGADRAVDRQRAALGGVDRRQHDAAAPGARRRGSSQPSPSRQPLSPPAAPNSTS